MTARVPLSVLPIKPDPEWYGWPGPNRGESVSHGYARGTADSPSLCGRAVLGPRRERPPEPRRICYPCSQRWSKQYPQVKA